MDYCNLFAGIVAAVSVLLLSREGDVLMTRRAPHMRTFPGIWVPPGGHVEAGESIAAAGLRELWEETGVKDHLCDPQVGIDANFVIDGDYESIK